MHAQGHRIAFGVLAVRPDHRWREAMPLIKRSRAHSCVGMRAESHAVHAIAIFEAGQIAKQRIFQDWHEIAFEEDTGRFAARVLHDLDVVWRGRIARHSSVPERQRVGNRRKGTAAPPAPHCTDVDGVVGSDSIKVVPGRKAAVGQLLGATNVLMRRLAHRHEHDPLASRCHLRRTSDDIDNVGDGVKTGDGDATSRLETFPVRMRMRVEEPRQYRTTLEVDELGGGSGIFEDLRIVADGRNETRSHRDGLRNS
jgi:hypothetical protein